MSNNVIENSNDKSTIISLLKEILSVLRQISREISELAGRF